jgi:membrane protein YdbS with pleckstrin-like domain
MSGQVDRLCIWIYQGVWGVLANWFCVPREHPTLPTHHGESLETFRPAQGFLRYLKVTFWIGLIIIDILILGGWLFLTIAAPIAGLLLAPAAFAIAFVPDLLAYVAIHLRYDTTWYVLSDRSLRIRRGIWVIRETTITYDNIQNVTVRQGPLQRIFGIADVIIETAGGGAATSDSQQQGSNTHLGLIEGVDNAPVIRDRLLGYLRKSATAGLGDEDTRQAISRTAWTTEHLAVLREIRDACGTL